MPTPLNMIYGVKDGIYRSPRSPISLPQNPNFSMIPFLFRNISSLSHSPALIDAETGQTLSLVRILDQTWYENITKHCLTFSDLRTHVFNFSQSLLNLNISKNDVVLIFSPNSILYPVAFLAVVAIGAIATTANPQYTTAELFKQVKDSNPKLIITTHELYDKIKHFNIPCIMLDNSYLNGSSSSKTLFSNLKLPSVAQTDVAAILYSSGTTGTSKGVVLTHKNFIATAMMTTSDQDSYEESKINVFLCFLPMFHVFGLSCVMYAQLQRGNTVVVMALYEMEKMLRAIEKHKVTHMFAVPPVIIALAKHKKVVEKYDVSSLREIGSGAAPVGMDVLNQCAKCFPQAVVYQAYGMTEAGGIISLEDTRTSSHHSCSSTGLLVPGVEAQIMNLQTMKPLPPLQKGEIWVRSAGLMQGYFKNEIATMETIDDRGWLHTGDLGYFDNEGRLYVVDRMKELIKCKGFQVAPAELEELLLAHPEIKDAAVIGFPNAEAGEVPVAYVVRSSISSLTGEEIQFFIAKQVAPFKRLRRVIFTDAIPKSASGKILRRELQQNLESKL